MPIDNTLRFIRGSAYELMLIGYLDDIWPFPVAECDNSLDASSRAVEYLKRFHREKFDSILMLPPEEGAKAALDMVTAARLEAGKDQVGYILAYYIHPSTGDSNGSV